ncbi:MAG: beta-galactosidase [Acholeplasmatales bacterium]|jgi:beta-galactosidase|nr:beta-galactosidase [Acholeplasmatales bacterium]
MVNYEKRNFKINGKEVLIIAGEIHYFRIEPLFLESRFDLLIEAGANTVSTYVPWVVHETSIHNYDFNGKSNKYFNLINFLEIAKKKNLFVFLRPGPFVMAELKNEGIPDYIYDIEDIIPLNFDLKTTPTRTIDYINPLFLNEVEIYFHNLYLNIKDYFYPNGPVIGIQLDNEVGMLSWVANSLDMSCSNWEKFKGIYKEYQGIKFDDLLVSCYDLSLESKLLDFKKNLYQEYINKLLDIWTRLGVKDILYFVNIHGTEQGYAFSFPIGINQLRRTYENNKIIPGNDLYLSDVTLDNFSHFYIVNKFLLATVPKDKPISTLEFNASNGDFGDSLSNRIDPSSLEFKIYLSFALGERMVNYYSFAGGYNYRLDKITNIGNDRISFTGERHGFSAPLTPEGLKNYHYSSLKKATHIINNLENKIISMYETKFDFTAAFIDEYFDTWNANNKISEVKNYIDDLKFGRNNLFWNALRHSLLLHYSFDSVFLSDDNDPITGKVLLVGLTKYLSRKVQEKLVSFLDKGGKLLVFNEFPVFDDLGNKCTILIDYLKINPSLSHFDYIDKDLSVYCSNKDLDIKEFRSYFANSINSNYEEIFKIYGSNECCSFIGDNIGFIGTNIIGDLRIMKFFLDKLNVSRSLKDFKDEGNLLTILNENEANEKLLYLFNLDYLDKTISYDGLEIKIKKHDSLILPFDIKEKNYTIFSATLTLSSFEEDAFLVEENSNIGYINLSLKDNSEIKYNKYIKIERYEDFNYTLKILPHDRAIKIQLKTLKS